MDTSAPEIRFDDEGFCNFCTDYFERAVPLLIADPLKREERLQAVVAEIKAYGKGRRYDCILGVSGGVDSTYLAYFLRKIGLRILAVHVDNGWNSELAVHNIERILKKLDVELYTNVLDWQEFRDLQISFLKASTPDLEIPTDHAFMAYLWQVAAKMDIRYIINGSNITTEWIMPLSWSNGHADWHFIKSIHKRFGTIRLRTFPHFGIVSQLYYRFVLRQKHIRLLNLLDYKKGEAMRVIERELGWEYYGGKHYESTYTKFVQAYILPTKFGIDKRKAHLATLVCSGEITREEALAELKEELYPEAKLRQDRDFVNKKLGLSADEFEAIMKAPIKDHDDYPTIFTHPLYRIAKALYQPIKRLRKGLSPAAKTAIQAPVKV